MFGLLFRTLLARRLGGRFALGVAALGVVRALRGRRSGDDRRGYRPRRRRAGRTSGGGY